MARTLLTIESARAGIHGAFDGEPSTISGCGRAADTVAEYAADGTWIVAKAGVADIVSAVLRSPMLDSTLAPGEVRSFRGEVLADPACAAFLGTLAQFGDGGTMRGLVALAVAEPGGFDACGVEVYARWWSARGAKVGRLYPSRDAVEWLDGTVGTVADACEALDAWGSA